MKKIFFLFLFVSFIGNGFSQDLYKSSKGEISFFSKTPMENIDAVNSNLKALINSKNGEIAFIVTNIGFKFEKPLMEEHFNENYIESDKYKSSMFKGKIIGDVDFTKDGTYPVKVKGTLNIHGVDQEREIDGELIVKGGALKVNSKFGVNLKDHKIKIPKLVVKNIAKSVDVTVDIEFELK